VPADAVIHVGDHLDADVRGAEAVGISGVLIDRVGRYTADDLPNDVTVIRSLDELLPIVDERLDAEDRLAG
jgi:FMN phosphatase YigB (HAD superfamily)